MAFDENSYSEKSDSEPIQQKNRPGSAPSHVQGNRSRNSTERTEKTINSENQDTVHEKVDEKVDDVLPEEEEFPNPEKYDRWLVQAIPPRPALSAGRSRTQRRTFCLSMGATVLVVGKERRIDQRAPRHISYRQ